MKKIGSFLAFITWLALIGVLFYFFFGFMVVISLLMIIVWFTNDFNNSNKLK